VELCQKRLHKAEVAHQRLTNIHVAS
jgi:hypothetical protein